eukprot:7983861-Heterocapsa_arctica.AAC.1
MSIFSSDFCSRWHHFNLEVLAVDCFSLSSNSFQSSGGRSPPAPAASRTAPAAGRTAQRH